jgi:hypothetical protein
MQKKIKAKIKSRGALLFVFLVGGLIIFPNLQVSAKTVWQAAGPAKGYVSAGAGYETDISASSQNQVYAAFEDKSYSKKIRVRKYNGSSWVDLADSNNPHGLITSSPGLKPSVAAKGDEVYVAFTEKATGWRIHVKRWDGSSWSDLADGSHADDLISSGMGYEPELEWDKSQTNLYVAFQDMASGGKVKVMKWDGSAWQDASDGSHPNGLVSSGEGVEAGLAASQIDDSIYLTYEDTSAGLRLRVKKYDGANWTDVTDAAHADGLITNTAAYSPSIAVDSQDRIYLVYTYKKEGATRIIYWNGTSWLPLGNGIVTSGKTIESQVNIDSGDRITVAYSQLKKTGKKSKSWGIRTARWDGQKWVDQRSLSKKGKGDPSLTLGSGKVFIIFTDCSARKKVRVMFY